MCGSGNTDKTNKKQFFHKRIAVNDCENQNLKNYFNEAFDFIDLAKLNNQKVLVHCQAGISRSPTIVVAYLMSKLHLDMNDAYNQVKNQRPIIGPNLIFMSQLMDFEINLHKNNAKNPDSLNYKSSAPPSTPIIQSTQIQFNNQKENSENNSPDVVNASSNSYFKLQAANKCLNSNSGENNSILVFN